MLDSYLESQRGQVVEVLVERDGNGRTPQFAEVLMQGERRTARARSFEHTSSARMRNGSSARPARERTQGKRQRDLRPLFQRCVRACHSLKQNARRRSGDVAAPEALRTSRLRACCARRASGRDVAVKRRTAVKQSWFQRLKSGLGKTSSKLTSGITDLFSKRKLDANTLDDLEDLLIQSDLGLETTSRITTPSARDASRRAFRPTRCAAFWRRKSSGC